MDIQKLMDVMGEADLRTRSRYHLTLGRLVEALMVAPISTRVEYDCGGGPTEPHSYRGYYSDLAFQNAGEPVPVEQVLIDAKAAFGAEFTGYKGGEFLMGPDTPLWLSSYGDAGGRAITGVEQQPGRLVLLTRVID